MGAAPTSTADDRSERRVLEGRRLLVTGASSGIGAATATAAAAAGARVGLLARRVTELERLAGRLAGGAGRHAVVPADVRDDDAAASAVAAAAEQLGGLDGLVNSAGVVVPRPLLEGDPADWRATFGVNVLGLLAVTHAAVPHLVEAATDGPSDLVNVSSISGRRRPNAAMSAYAASKSAVHVLSEGYREELAPLGVRTTIVSPGYVVTPIFTGDEHRTAHSDDFDDRMRRRGLPVERVAAAIVDALATPADTMLYEVGLLSVTN